MWLILYFIPVGKSCFLFMKLLLASLVYFKRSKLNEILFYLQFANATHVTLSAFNYSQEEIYELQFAVIVLKR